MYVTILLGNIYILRSTIYFILLSSSTRRRFYPQRSSGQAVVTGVVPSRRYVPSIFIAHRVQHIPLYNTLLAGKLNNGQWVY